MRRHLGDISPAPDKQCHLSEHVVYKAVETLSGLRYLKTATAHTTLYQRCVGTKKHDRDNATSYLQ